jgi:porin
VAQVDLTHARTTAVASVAGLLLSAGIGHAQDAPNGTAPDPNKDSPRPVSFTAAYTLDLLQVVGGGRARGSAHLQKLALSAAYDGAKGGHNGWAGLLSVQATDGGGFSGRYVGDVQTVSNLDDVNAVRLYEAWLSHELPVERGVVKAGLIDLNSEFDIQETAALFLNSGHGIGSEFSHTGFDGPSIYPTPALGLTVLTRPAKAWALRAGVFDGVAGDPNHPRRFDIQISARTGALLVVQAERRWGDRWRIEAGVWGYTARFSQLNYPGPGPAPQLGGDVGAYALAEGRLQPKPDGAEGGLSGWIRLGVADDRINRIAGYQGAGLVYAGPFPGRDKDQVGLAIARAAFGGPARTAAFNAGGRLGAAETTLEATYRVALRGRLTLQPDMQYVIHPGGDPVRRNATVVGLRLAFTGKG